MRRPLRLEEAIEKLVRLLTGGRREGVFCRGIVCGEAFQDTVLQVHGGRRTDDVADAGDIEVIVALGGTRQKRAGGEGRDGLIKIKRNSGGIVAELRRDAGHVGRSGPEYRSDTAAVRSP